MAYPYKISRLLHHALRWALHHHRVHHTRLPSDGVSRVRCFVAYPFVSTVVHLIQLPPNYSIRMLHPPMGNLTPRHSPPGAIFPNECPGRCIGRGLDTSGLSIPIPTVCPVSGAEA